MVAAGYKKPYASFPDNGTLAQSLRPFPQFLNVWSRNSGQGQTWYDAATVKVTRRFGNWQFTSSYVRSKSLGLLTYRQIFSQNQVYPQDMYNLNQGKSYLPFDLPNVFNFLSSYSLPFGKGQALLRQQQPPAGCRRRRLDNRRHAPVPQRRADRAQLHQHSGQRRTVHRCADVQCQRRATFGPARAAPRSTPTIRTASTSTRRRSRFPSQFSFGTSSQYNSNFRQPPVLIDNISLVKQLAVWPSGDGNKVRLQFSANAFNPFNRTNFGVNGTVGNANFGRASGPQYGPRLITMVLRLVLLGSDPSLMVGVWTGMANRSLTRQSRNQIGSAFNAETQRARRKRGEAKTRLTGEG